MGESKLGKSICEKDLSTLLQLECEPAWLKKKRECNHRLQEQSKTGEIMRSRFSTFMLYMSNLEYLTDHRCFI